MKKILALLIAIVLSVSLLASCTEPDNTVINIGVMSGPTGMGMAKLMTEQDPQAPKYNFTVFNTPNTATAELLSGNLDMLCLPTNTAATLATKNADTITVLSINCLGSLYLLTDSNTEIKSIADLAGKTIVASVPNSTTGPIIEYILSENNVDATVEFEADHDALVERIAKNEVSIAVLPEPKVTAAIMQNNTYSVDLNLSTEWEKISDSPLTMGCLVVRNEFLKEHSSLVKSFLKEYKASIEYIGDIKNLDSAAQMIYDAGVLPKLPIAKNALKNLNGSIVYLDGKEMKSALKAFYDAIALTQPSDDFYYD